MTLPAHILFTPLFFLDHILAFLHICKLCSMHVISHHSFAPLIVALMKTRYLPKLDKVPHQLRAMWLHATLDTSQYVREFVGCIGS